MARPRFQCLLQCSRNTAPSSLRRHGVREWETIAPFARVRQYSQNSSHSGSLTDHQPVQTRTTKQFKKQYATSVESDRASHEATSLSDQRRIVSEACEEILRIPAQSKRLPQENEILDVLKLFRGIADAVKGEDLQDNRGSTIEAATKPNATSSFLRSVDRSKAPGEITTTELLRTISIKAHKLFQEPCIFVTPAILEAYIKLELSLGNISRVADIFRAYREKPTPQYSSNSPQLLTFSAPSPDAASAAIPTALATAAIDAAIAKHSLPLCLSIIDETFSTPSHAKSKTLRAAIVPITGLALAPFAAYAIAHHFSFLQTTMAPEHATKLYMAGILTYILSVGSMGYISITTANDNMVRVTWAAGMPLWERWVKEEERAAVDRVAQAWGFREKHRWGDEEGEEWEALKEWAGYRGMVLDNVERMEGMQ